MIGRRVAHEDRVRAWEIAAALLRYPDAALLAALPQIAAAAGELRGEPAREVAALARAWSARELLDLQREYVEVFDLDRRSALHVSWHRYGDKRQRGVVLLGLKRRFEAHGFTPAGEELPDWLPMMLEFAARAPEPAGLEMLEAWRPSIELIRRTLRDAGRDQVAILDLVSAVLPKLGGGVEKAIARLLAEGPPDEDVGLEPYGPDSEMGLLSGDLLPGELPAGVLGPEPTGVPR